MRTIISLSIPYEVAQLLEKKENKSEYITQLILNDLGPQKNAKELEKYANDMQENAVKELEKANEIIKKLTEEANKKKEVAKENDRLHELELRFKRDFEYLQSVADKSEAHRQVYNDAYDLLPEATRRVSYSREPDVMKRLFKLDEHILAVERLLKKRGLV